MAVAVVTGAAAGIGAATALLLAQRGWRVLAVDVSEPSVPLGDAVFVPGDVAAAQTATRCLELATDLGPVEALVNCAAVRVIAPAADTDEKVWRHTLDVNLTGPFLMASAVLPQMVERESGSIVNVGSLAGHGRPNMLAYSASKGGLAAMTKAMALDVADHGVRVNLVVPGITAPARIDNASSPRLWARARVNSVLKRPNTPEEVAEVIAWLCQEGTSISGSVMEVGTLPRYPQEPSPITPENR